jgi:transposase
VTPSERATLEQWVRRRATAQGLALRARIVLACTSARTDVNIARELHVHRDTVGEWRRRFQRARLEGLLDEPRPGAPRRISDRMVERVITETLETTPTDATHWSTRTMARATGMSQSAPRG